MGVNYLGVPAGCWSARGRSRWTVRRLVDIGLLPIGDLIGIEPYRHLVQHPLGPIMDSFLCPRNKFFLAFMGPRQSSGHISSFQRCMRC